MRSGQKSRRATSKHPKVMINTPYAGSWFMASTESYVARLIADAGGDYIYKKNTSNRSLPIDLEEAYMLTAQADMWLNAGSAASLGELKSQFPKFANTRCVRNGAVYNCNKRLNAARRQRLLGIGRRPARCRATRPDRNHAPGGTGRKRPGITLLPTPRIINGRYRRAKGRPACSSASHRTFQ